jgi:ADP-heptose:LPS heptosyltransferase
MDSAGDVLLMGPAVRALARRAGRVTFLAGPLGADAAALLPGVDELLVHHCPWIDAEPHPVTRTALNALVADVAALGVHEAVIFTSFHQSPLPLALLMRLAGVPTVAATSTDYPGSLLDVRHRAAGELHEVERALSLVARLGYLSRGVRDRRLEVRRPDLPSAPPVQRPYVVVHPGASASARAWAPQRHAELVAALEERGHAVVVTGAPSETELTARVAAGGSGRAHDLGGQTDLAGLAEILAGGEVVVVGNTGPAHLAAAVGTPVVSLFAPTVPATRWRPWGVDHELLSAPVPCHGCRVRTCPVPGHPCLESVSTAAVVAAAERLAPRMAVA